MKITGRTYPLINISALLLLILAAVLMPAVISDPANAVDLELGSFGKGGDVPVAGDWNGDGKTEIGVFRPSTRMWYLDYNRDGRWMLLGQSEDRLLGDFGKSDDIPVTGDWNGDGKTEIGVFRPSNRMWYLDYNGDGRWNLAPGDDRLLGDFGKGDDKPVTGDWNGDGKTEIGVFRPFTRMWYLDYNGDGRWNLASRADDRLMGDFGKGDDMPVTWDWNADGKTEIGVFRPSTCMWYLDYNGDGRWMLLGQNEDMVLGPFGQSTDKPLAGIW